MTHNDVYVVHRETWPETLAPPGGGPARRTTVLLAPSSLSSLLYTHTQYIYVSSTFDPTASARLVSPRQLP